jgi:hypothetical protein
MSQADTFSVTAPSCAVAVTDITTIFQEMAEL